MPTQEQILNMDTAVLLDLYRTKMLVCVCKPQRGCFGKTNWRNPTPNHCGPQRTALTALREIQRRGVTLPRALNIAASEDNSCGRRSGSAGSCEVDTEMNRLIATRRTAGV